MRIDFPQRLKDRTLPGSFANSGGTTVYQGGSYGYGSSSSYDYSNGCKHEGDTLIFERDGKQLYGANNQGLNEYDPQWGLIIDLAGVVSTDTNKGFVRSLKEKFRRLNAFQVKPPKVMTAEYLRLDWPDMSVPPVTLQFWEELWKLLPAKTVCCCMGGHGRTGSCLTALMIVAGESYYAALEHVRKVHCTKAVETIAQEKYLHGLYVDRLDADIEAATAAGDIDLIAALEAERLYATQHVPSLQTTEAVKSKGSAPKSGGKLWDRSASTEVGVTYWTDSKGTEWKKDADGFLWVKECGEAHCKVEDCKKPKHQWWIRVDMGGDDRSWMA